MSILRILLPLLALAATVHAQYGISWPDGRLEVEGRLRMGWTHRGLEREAGHSLVPPGGFMVWCDNQPEQGAFHAPFALSAGGEVVGLSDPAGRFLDPCTFGPQSPDVSEGRSPDGGAPWRSVATPTPGAANLEVPPPGQTRLLINEFLASNDACCSDEPGEFDDWVELHNTGDAPDSLNGLYLNDSASEPLKWRLNPPATACWRRDLDLLHDAHSGRPQPGPTLMARSPMTNARHAKVVAWILALSALTFLCGCYERGESLAQGDWELVSVHALAVPEPSGLCLDPDGRHHWIVSGETGLIHRLDLEGRLVQSLAFGGEDLEGIAIDPASGNFWVAEERRNQAVRRGAGGPPARLGGGDELRLRGRMVDGQGRVLLAIEKNPGRLLVLDPATGKVSGVDLDFARDYSGLCWDEGRQGLWVLSDESRALYFLREGEGPVEYKLGFERLEGVAVAGDSAWLVFDALSRLYHIQLK
jgi:hypothetical protein